MIDQERYEALVASGVAEAEGLVRLEQPSVIITDLRMPDMDGLTGLQRFHDIDPDVPVVLITAFGTVETAVEAMKLGAFDYIRKPFEPSEIEIVIERAIQHRDLVKENARLRSEVATKFSKDNIICRSTAMANVISLVGRVAPSDFSVLMLGESGTGKDLFAKRVHHLSRRADKPFISINCSAIPEHLLESELFGHERGAFSGATNARAGFFAEADGGTLFLDEIGDMSLALQPKLLRVLQDGEYYRVGSRKLAKTDVRLVCASNRHIEDLVKEGTFRQDLYYRINTVKITLPPLRERKEDIPLLVNHFLERIRKHSPDTPTDVNVRAMRMLLDYNWPGNVRELEHCIERASLVADHSEISPNDLPPEVRGAVSPSTLADTGRLSFKEARAQFERDYFNQLLDEVEGNIPKAAELAGVHRSTFYEKLGKLGIEPR